MSTKENKIFNKAFYKYLSPFLLFFAIICFFPYWFTSSSWFNVNFSSTGQIGDTIGGIMTPFIGMAAAILTFMAFWAQYKANEQQKEALEQQRIDIEKQKLEIQIQQFDTKFFHLINNQNQILRDLGNPQMVRGSSSPTGRQYFKELY